MKRRGAIVLLAGLLAGGGACSPTITLGSNGTATSTTGTSTTSESVESVASSDTPASGTVDATSGDAGGLTDETTVGTTTGSSSGSVCGLPFETGACTDCAQEQCCAEVEFCMSQPECSCFLDCIDDQPSGLCQTACGGVSGIAAVMVCLGMSCTAECGFG